MPKNKKITRVPRPKGYTYQLQTYHKTKDKKQLLRLKKLTIEQWTLNNYQFNGQTYTLQQISEYISLPIPMTMEYMNNALLKMANFFDIGGENQDWARAQFFRTLFLGMENQALSRQQVEILMQSQGGSYKAFISRDVNGAIANLNATQKTQNELLKTISDSMKTQPNTPSIFNLNVNSNASSKQYISQEQALQIVRDNSQSLLDNPAGVQGILSSTEMPNVDARTQDLTSIGIKTLAHPEGPKKVKKGLKALSHKGRKTIHKPTIVTITPK